MNSQILPNDSWMTPRGCQDDPRWPHDKLYNSYDDDAHGLLQRLQGQLVHMRRWIWRNSCSGWSWVILFLFWMILDNLALMFSRFPWGSVPMVCLGVLGASRKHTEMLSGYFVLASIALQVGSPSETTPPPLSQRAPRCEALTAPAFEALTPIQPSIVAKLFSKLSMLMPINSVTPPRKARDDSDRIMALAASPLPARIGQLARDLPKNNSKAQSKGKTPATKPKVKQQKGPNV